MKRNFFHSTVFKIVALMFLVSFLAIVSMFSSVYISDGAQSDALAVNIAGSLRMQSYRISNQISELGGNSDESKLKSLYKMIDEFENDLTTGILVSQQMLLNSDESRLLYKRVKNTWQEQMKPIFLAQLKSQHISKAELNTVVANFVELVNSLVSTYQRHAEKNIASIRLIQSIALFSTLILIAFAMFIVNRHIERPLNNLTEVAKQIGRGDFTVQADESGKGELALLAKTFNKMSQSIYRSRTQLEEQVKRKTQKLSRSNESLNLLFQVSRKINEVDPLSVNFEPVLKQLAQVTQVKDLDLCIMSAQGNAPYEHLVTAEKELPQKCIEHDCFDCTQHNELFPQSNKQLKYQLTHSGTNYGVLVVHPDEKSQLEDWQHQLFESIAEQIANGLSLKHQSEQGRRIALMNERTVIARELHDSLAQALSYLKIQVTRLQKLQQKDNVQAQIDEVIDELKNGLSSAYRELRELLTTFRLKLDGQSLRAAFEQTISQLQSRSDRMQFNLDYRVGHVPFSPQEEIHLLQIAREASQNAFHHSKGDHVDIKIEMDSVSNVTLSVRDNGIGIPEDPSKLNHYGLAIMQERSRNLDGNISITSVDQGGTLVMFSFVPEYAKNTAPTVQSA